MVSSVSCGHAATNPDVGGDQLSFPPFEHTETWIAYEGAHTAARPGGLSTA